MDWRTETFNNLANERGALPADFPGFGIGVSVVLIIHDVDTQFAIENLSLTEFALEPLQQFKLAREHQIADWFVDSLVALAKKTPPMSLE